ncbi:Leucine-rich repeat receptor protein kinase MSP1 [Zea mays]|uniref:Leucine-rich repeat receptor protein kinase MSP1 n=1 Tax=Zea mays TaxID=4577 RepID=A0A3L6DLD0_MAIZE|nr:Leucine-rich repeat receptor protein kinase MSP1 [Zea mays]
MGSLFFVFILLICFTPSSALAGHNDINILFKLREAVTEVKGFLRDWFDSEKSPCSWSGITCVENTVVRIDLSSVPIYAPFPLCVGSFQSLAHLNFSGCGFFGELPDALGNLHSLEYLDLSHNQLTGALPVSLYGLKTLKEMVLDNNFFSGQLSPAIAQLKYLFFR